MKSKTTAYLLWFFLGFLGGHKFYLGKIGTGILYILTLGFFGIGWFFDLFTLGGQVDRANALLGRQYGSSNHNGNTNNIVVNVPSQNANNIPSVYEQLKRLHELKEQGILSEQEYNSQKIKVLG